jgi:hypothetical protein
MLRNAETSLYAAIENLLEAEQAVAFLDRNNKIVAAPFWQMRVATPAGTENVDTNAVGAEFVTNKDIINEAVVAYYTREVNTETVISETKTLKAGEEYEIRVSSLETEQRRIMLGDVTLTAGGAYGGIIRHDTESIVFEANVSGDDVQITVSATVVKIGKKQTITKQSAGSLDRYRSRFAEKYDFKLIQSEAQATSVANRVVTREGFPYVYVEEMSFVDYHPYEIGDTVLLTGEYLIAGGTAHYIVGEEHQLQNDTIQSSYFMLGSDAAKIFIIGVSLIDGDVEPVDFITGNPLTEAQLNAIQDNLRGLKSPPTDVYTPNEVSDYSTTSTSWVAIDATNLNLSITTVGGDVLVSFYGHFARTAGSATAAHLTLYVDGVDIAASSDGLVRISISTNPAGFTYLVQGLSAASHTFELRWKISAGTGTMTFYVGAGTSQLDLTPQFFVKEL